MPPPPSKAKSSEFHSALTYASPNVNELFAMAGHAAPDQVISTKRQNELCSRVWIH